MSCSPEVRDEPQKGIYSSLRLWLSVYCPISSSTSLHLLAPAVVMFNDKQTTAYFIVSQVLTSVQKVFEAFDYVFVVTVIKKIVEWCRSTVRFGCEHSVCCARSHACFVYATCCRCLSQLPKSSLSSPCCLVSSYPA